MCIELMTIKMEMYTESRVAGDLGPDLCMLPYCYALLQYAKWYCGPGAKE